MMDKAVFNARTALPRLRSVFYSEVSGNGWNRR